ncbi:glutathione S-transferase family protein [Methylorubrum aminovorans]|uniref:glutathione S-transferase family protein n=1 Tax=Methylorubrum aminovorans TaxID=269069 RepID=UPI003C2E4D97
MKLYSLTLSGHAHRARLFLSLLGLPFETVEVDFAGGQNRSPDFLAINSFGQVPVFDDAGVIVPDSNAILVYLAKKLGRGDWLPEDAEGAARVQRWLSVAAGPIANGPCAARLVTLFGGRFDAAEVIARAHQILALIDAELSARDWLAAERPTIADVALYSYIAAAPEGNVDLAAYGHVRAWLARIEALPGYVALPASPVGLNATGGSA